MGLTSTWPNGKRLGRPLTAGLEADQVRKILPSTHHSFATATWESTLQPTSYVCGPTSFVERATDLLIGAGHDREKIRTERFGATGERK